MEREKMRPRNLDADGDTGEYSKDQNHLQFFLGELFRIKGMIRDVLSQILLALLIFALTLLTRCLSVAGFEAKSLPILR